MRPGSLGERPFRPLSVCWQALETSVGAGTVRGSAKSRHKAQAACYGERIAQGFGTEHHGKDITEYADDKRA